MAAIDTGQHRAVMRGEIQRLGIAGIGGEMEWNAFAEIIGERRHFARSLSLAVSRMRLSTNA